MFNLKVTKIGKRYHARLFVENELYDEMACYERQDIGWICREMLRWVDKTGLGNSFTSAARKRQQLQPIGKVWYKNEI